MNAIIDLLNVKGYKNTGDNRSFDIRSINSLIELGVLSFDFVEAEQYNKEEGGRSFLVYVKRWQETLYCLHGNAIWKKILWTFYRKKHYTCYVGRKIFRTQKTTTH